ncbi:MAG: hypothetical protein RR565_04665 [Erysipelothrix sp.]
MKKANQKEIIAYIHGEMAQAKKNGKTEITLVSGEVHNELEDEHRTPSVCSAMYKCMKSNDIVMHTTPSGNSSTIAIKYFLD